MNIMGKVASLLAISLAVLAQGAFAGMKPNAHAPIGVMGDHRHKSGEWMLSYRFMRMQMDGLLEDTDELSAAQLVGTMANPGEFMVAPEEMTMDMHMLGAMYAPNDQLTLMLMVPYLDNEMQMFNRMGARPTMETSGVGDIKLSGLYSLWHSTDAHQAVHLNLGISLPTGSITEETRMTMNGNSVSMRVPYPMQLGSGTYDLLPGLTYRGHLPGGSWGAQINAVIRLGENGEDYTLGDRWQTSAWLGKNLNDWCSASMRLSYLDKDNIEGEDTNINPMMSPLGRTDAQGGQLTNLGLGVNFLLPRGRWAGHRFALEYALPVQQDLDGPQMETEWVLTLGWQKAWGH